MRYLSRRKENQHKPVIDELIKHLQSNQHKQVFIEGDSSTLYEDFWNIRTKYFKFVSNRLRFKKQHNGLIIEVFQQLTSQTSFITDMWDGMSFDVIYNRGEIASRLLEINPSKARFLTDPSLTVDDILKLKKLAISLHYTMKREDSFLCFIPDSVELQQHETKENDG